MERSMPGIQWENEGCVVPLPADCTLVQDLGTDFAWVYRHNPTGVCFQARLTEYAVHCEQVMLHPKAAVMIASFTMVKDDETDEIWYLCHDPVAFAQLMEV